MRLVLIIGLWQVIAGPSLTERMGRSLTLSKVTNGKLFLSHDRVARVELFEIVHMHVRVILRWISNRPYSSGT